MGIGERKQIQLIQLTSSKGPEGNWNSEAGTPTNTWAEVTSVNQSRDYANGQTGISETKRFKVRFRYDKHPGVDWKIRYDSKDWTVSSVIRENEKSFYWIITASA
jgi:SPP1 family predicted phage head-tail adaptor